jgi:PelA/Pel-15E family pectate lyase
LGGAALAAAAEPPARQQAIAAMKRATAFMTGTVAVHGGYVWSYLPDFSRRWGEMEARSTMIWLQAPGTASMGHAFLDALHATGEDFFYRAAEQVAGALLAAQHPAGGWHYIHDFAGEKSLREWYDTVGRNGWRLEEYQHYYGNATFDDSTTKDCAEFMLRLYLEKRDPQYRASLDRTLAFVLASQDPSGGWPQRYPPAGEFSKNGLPDYTGFITFNDGVTAGNVELLITCYQALDDEKLLPAIRRGMEVFLATQQPAPQPGWSLQHTTDLKPAGARSYEPPSLATHTTAACIGKLIDFYYLTGEAKYLARLPEALDWLDAVKLPPNTPGARGSHPTFVEVGSNRPLYIHRTGSNAINGRYFADHDPRHTIGHYSSFRTIDTAGLRVRYAQAKATPPAEAAKDSPLQSGRAPVPLPRYFTLDGAGFFAFGGPTGTPAERAASVIAALDADGRWLAPLRSTSHPYTRDGAKEVTPGDFGATQVGDDTDTSPYRAPQAVPGISTGTFIRNLGVLIRFLEETR